MLAEENGIKLQPKEATDVLPSSIDEIMSKKTSQISGTSKDN